MIGGESLINLSLQRIHFVHVRGIVMPVNRDDERQAHRCFRQRNSRLVARRFRDRLCLYGKPDLSSHD